VGRKVLARAGALAACLLLLFVPAVNADTIENTIASTTEDVTIVPGGSTTVGFFVQAAKDIPPGDPAGCGSPNNSPATVNLSVPEGVSASSASLTFAGCGTVRNVIFSSNTPGDYAIFVASLTGGKAGALFDVAPAAFTLHVVAADSTPPVITKTVTGTAGANGWYISNVTVAWTVSDPESAVVIDSGCGIQNFTSETAGLASTCAAHSAGGSASDSFTVKIDTTGPSATLAVTAGTLGLNDWYTSDVTVSTSGSDSISEPVVCTPNQFQTTDTTGNVFNGSCTNSAGFTTNASPLTVKVDKSGPTAALSVTAVTEGANGWYVSDVTVHTTGTSIAGDVVCTPDQYQTTETAGTDFHGSCTDPAGLTGDAPALTIKLDKTGPSASLSATGLSGANGWYIGDVTVSTSGSDSISGPVVCTADQYQTAETAGTVFNGSCTNDAGLTTDAAPLTVKLDKTAPTISAAATAPPDGSNGWYKSDVTVHFTCYDALSGIPAGACPADQVLSTEGSSISATAQTVTDAAGNVSDPSGPLTVKIDKTAPTDIAFLDSGLTDGGFYYFGFVPDEPIRCTADDSLSGLDTCTVAGGGKNVGWHTITATAMDKAGNSSTKTMTYTVMAWALAGFYQPVNMATNEWNTVKGGSTVPLKFQIFAGATQLTSTSVVVGFTAIAVTCPSGSHIEDIIDVTATGGTALRYDTTAGQFIFNWQTPKKPGACYKLTMTTQDGSTLVASFILK
jgi:hypothetical protein